MDGMMMAAVIRELNTRIIGSRIDRITQPEKQMLILFLRANGTNLKLLLSASPDNARLHLTKENYLNPMEAPLFCMLMRKHLAGGRILDICQPGGDRVCRIDIANRDEMGDEKTLSLYLEVMGHHSNLTLVKNGLIVDAIRHVTHEMSRVRQALPGLPFLPPPGQDRLNPWTCGTEEIRARLEAGSGRLDKAIGGALCGIGASTAAELALRVSGRGGARAEEDPAGFAEKLAGFLKRIPAMEETALRMGEDGLPAEVLPFAFLSVPAERQKLFRETGVLMDAFYSGRDLRLRMEQRNASLKKLIANALDKSGRKLALQQEELSQSERMEEWRVAGELLTSQAYLVPKGADCVRLVNYYDPDGGTVEIALDPALSASQNAQKYFRRYRKARSGMKLASEQREKTLRELALLEQAAEDLTKCETETEMQEVRAFLAENGFVRPEAAKKGKRQEVSLPRHYLSSSGKSIYVGKNSAQNDRLTREAAGDDLWLHAKNMPGSHVIVRGGAENEEELTQALKLAAYYSKGHGVQVPVDYTLRRFVKKPGGSPPGFFIYSQEKTRVVNCTEGEIYEMRTEKEKGT